MSDFFKRWNFFKDSQIDFIHTSGGEVNIQIIILTFKKYTFYQRQSEIRQILNQESCHGALYLKLRERKSSQTADMPWLALHIVIRIFYLKL